MEEIDLIKTHHGKWSQPNVPHKGWHCVDIEDTKTLTSICNMCESQKIRFVHYMEHKDYSGTLAVGCVCAGYMEDDLVAARDRDNFMRSRASKKSRWISRKWNISHKGNDYIKTDGYVVAIFQNKNGMWGYSVQSVQDPLFKEYGGRLYKTSNEAKIGSFDFLTKVLSENKNK